MGYGDYSPNTLSEKVFGIITEILGVTGYAYIIAFLSDLLSSKTTATGSARRPARGGARVH